ncbi:MAG: SRPBCC family protein [bacterium]
MTEITRSIEIQASRNRVWAHIQPRNWTKIFDFVREVNGCTEDGEAGVGTEARIETGEDDTAVKYKVAITEFVEHSRIAYRRYGGPLTGKGEIQIKSLGSGTLLRRTSYYDDDLSKETIRMLSEGLEKDNQRLKSTIEKTGSNPGVSQPVV